jgi:hypothetical protein
MGWIELTTIEGDKILVNMDNCFIVEARGDQGASRISSEDRELFVRETLQQIAAALLRPKILQQISELINDEDRRQANLWRQANGN